MQIVTSIYAYCSDLLPDRQGEISAILNMARVLGGFSVAYYQVPWAERAGSLQVFGVEAAIVVGVTAVIIPVLQFGAPWFEVGRLFALVRYGKIDAFRPMQKDKDIE
ncbi:hypothetical protein FRC08_014300 [Ceratobasidium sp. 394]|nr:hypothetical protein FRC08_014300 [Ceratobasidium sp. 394]